MTFPALRKRIPSEPVVLADLSAPHGQTGVLAATAPTAKTVKSGALSRIMTGVFGSAEPASSSESFQVAQARKALYTYHMGDLFTPGTQNYVFEYPFEFPLQTIWGNAFIRNPNTFKATQPPQVYSNPNVMQNGIGGLVAGQIALQGLESTGQ